MAVSCAAFGLGSVAVADCSGDGCSWGGWEGVVRRAASRCELSVAARICSANMCRRLLEAVETMVSDDDVRVESVRGLRVICEL